MTEREKDFLNWYPQEAEKILEWVAEDGGKQYKELVDAVISYYNAQADAIEPRRTEEITIGEVHSWQVDEARFNNHTFMLIRTNDIDTAWVAMCDNGRIVEIDYDLARDLYNDLPIIRFVYVGTRGGIPIIKY